MENNGTFESSNSIDALIAENKQLVARIVRLERNNQMSRHVDVILDGVDESAAKTYIEECDKARESKKFNEWRKAANKFADALGEAGAKELGLKKAPVQIHIKRSTLIWSALGAALVAAGGGAAVGVVAHRRGVAAGVLAGRRQVIDSKFEVALDGRSSKEVRHVEMSLEDPRSGDTVNITVQAPDNQQVA